MVGGNLPAQWASTDSSEVVTGTDIPPAVGTRPWTNLRNSGPPGVAVSFRNRRSVEPPSGPVAGSAVIQRKCAEAAPGVRSPAIIRAAQATGRVDFVVMRSARMG